MEKKFYKYIWNIHSEDGTYLSVCYDSEQYENMQGSSTVRYFKNFEKCYRRIYDHYTKFYTECNGHYHEEHFYDSLAELIRYENLNLIELNPGIHSNQKSFYGKAHIITDKNGINKGLKSYDELVAAFHSGKCINLLGYFSPTTTKHQDSYCFPNPMHYKYANTATKINKKFLDDFGFMCFE